MSLLWFLWRSSKGIRRSRATVVFVIIAGIISGGSNALLIALINSGINGRGGRAVIWAFVGVCVLLPLMRFLSQAFLARLTADIVYELRLSLCRRLFSVPLRVLEEHGQHRILATLTDDIPVITNALVTIPLICMHLAIVGACLVYMAYLSWPVLIGALAFMGLGVLSYHLAVRKASQYFRLARDHWDSLMKHFGALTQGTKELKLHRARREAFLADSLQSTASALRRYNVVGSIIFTAASSCGQSLVFALVGFLIFLAPNLGTIDRSVLTGYTLTILYLMTPLEVILNALPAWSRAGIAAQKIERLGVMLTEKSTEIMDIRAQDNIASWKSLELTGVSHSYKSGGKNDVFVLGPLSLRFQPGELVILMGGNGSGKTTLVKLITGLYTPEAGEIRLDGQPVTEESRESYRQLFSAVFSDFYLFDSLLGLERDELDADADQYLRRLQLDQVVEIEKGKLSTTELSQGQRKRLALLTAYLEDRPFYVFDEWAADQDPYFKDVFYNTLLPELKARGKTALVISHDDRYYHVADKIIKLDCGRIEYERTVPSPERLSRRPAPVPA